MSTLLPKLDADGGMGRSTPPVFSLRSAFLAYDRGFPHLPYVNAATLVRPLTYILFGSLAKVSGKGGDAAVAAAGEVPERRRRVRMVAWSAAWLVMLFAPAHEIARGVDHPAGLAAGLLAAFVALYLALWWLATNPNGNLGPKLALLALLGGIAVGGSLAAWGSWPFLFFYLSAAVACSLPEKRAVFGIGAITVLDAALVTRPALNENSVGPQIFGVFMAGLLVMFIIRLLRLIAELNSAREELARLAVADERLRFARDLHDLLGHTLSLIVVKSEAVRRLVHHDADAAARESGDIEMVSRQALTEVREAVTNYRERSLEAELEGARLALSAAGIEATINQLADRLPDTVESVLGWTVREGVTNVVRHSNGRHCAIDFHQRNGLAILEICDDGDSNTGTRRTPGFADGGTGAGGGGDPSRRGETDGRSDSTDQVDPTDRSERSGSAGRSPGGGESRAGTGLRGLAERLASAHGRLEAGRRADGGFRLAVTVPVGPEGQDPG